MYRNVLGCCLLVLILMGVVQGADWPMWKYDSGRTANSPAALPETMHLQWARQLPAARQAWRDKSNAMLFLVEVGRVRQKMACAKCLDREM